MIFGYSDKDIDDLIRRLKELERLVGKPRTTRTKYENSFLEEPVEVCEIEPSGIFKRLEDFKRKKK